ncbi:sigma-70 family RNA polymerase sigma factor [Streptomyces sp. H39-S7]|uniref:sigma-70 family RNA polymerase sigma factor n=1 Tax=Streptomyces sp. H39-S7 TaxID=3004357 RepID=UPI0022B0292F|nr:sigma-70 family RNA polymerase sigma factor [Streptomyces sp. H39-S7]MCZ4120351.1 sigma-70 family RNA polymerase sigma factor [Streptomyces sp. H39-S7]
MNLEDEFAQVRGELVVHCYRMLGSRHDAEDVVQDVYVRAWKGFAEFEQRSSVRTWLYRIATRLCLNALKHSSRRLVPSALGAPGNDPDDLDTPMTEATWLEPLPDHGMSADPATVVGTRQSLRLAMIAALQHLPPRQRAVLILRDVLLWPAAEVAAALDTTTVAVNSSLQRARAELARIAPSEEQVSEPDDPWRRDLLDRYARAFERADLVALEELLTQDVRWEMPPVPTWFNGRQDVLRLLAAKLTPGDGRRVMVETSANGQPAFALYSRGDDDRFHARYLQVLTLSEEGVTAILAFHRADLFSAFGLPPERPA